MRLEDTIREAALLFLEEHLTQGVIYQEVLNFLHGTEVIQDFETLSVKIALLGAAHPGNHFFLLREYHPSLVCFIVVRRIGIVILLMLIIKVD